MARIDNLNNFLNDVASAIKEKKGTTETVEAGKFDEEIKNIQTGITPTGTINITENGTHDVTNYESANVQVDGGDVSDYFETTITNSTYKYFVTNYLVKKIPTITIDSNVTNLNNSFCDARVSELKITGDTSNVTNMSGMFYNCNNLTTIPQLDTSNVTYMNTMFYNCNNLMTIPLLDTSKVTNMDSMFSYCGKLTTIPQLDTSNVTNMSSMFSYCDKLTTIPQLDTSNVTNMGRMFYSCRNLTTIPQLDTSNVTNMNTMFYSCRNLTTIPQLDASKVNSISGTFQYASALSDFGGLKNIGQAFSTTASANYNNYLYVLVQSNNLTHDSLMNVINGLYDIATAGIQPQKLSLGSTNLAKLTEDEIAIATNKGWNIS